MLYPMRSAERSETEAEHRRIRSRRRVRELEREVRRRHNGGDDEALKGVPRRTERVLDE